MSIKSVPITEFRVESRLIGSGQAEFVVIGMGQRVEEIPREQFERAFDDPMEMVLRNIKTRIDGLDIRSPGTAQEFRLERVK